VLLVLGFIILAIIGAAFGSHSETRPTQRRASSQAAPPVRRANATVLSVRGSGTKTTQTFTVGDEWDLAWSYNCANFSDGRGNFIVSIQQKGGGITAPAGVNELGTHGDSTEHYHDAGTYYLVMNSECDWAVKVVDRS
jgi:hypothetical protein